MWEIRQEARGDALHIDELSERSFGPGRFVKTVYRLREGVNAEQHLGFVAIEEGVLRGSVRFWPICVGTEASLMLGPLAVQPDQRGRGIGIALMNRGIEEARARSFWWAICLTMRAWDSQSLHAAASNFRDPSILRAF